jgi:hypothetical protein
MGHHDRLGRESMMAEVDPEVLREICEKVLKQYDRLTIDERI